MNQITKKSVLILCTGNSCRSQMAEQLWNHYGRGEWQAFSAGSDPAGYVHEMAKVAMNRIGLNIDSARSKSIEEFVDKELDLIVTVCDNARHSCSALVKATKTMHWPFDDPAEAAGSDSEKLVFFERVRDEIAAAIQQYLRESDVPS